MSYKSLAKAILHVFLKISGFHTDMCSGVFVFATGVARFVVDSYFFYHCYMVLARSFMVCVVIG